jgi:hypothetical protein
MNRIKSIPRKRLILIVVVVIIVVIGATLAYILVLGSSNNLPNNTSQNTDYSFFIAPNAGRVEAVREWLMQPYDPTSRLSFGYDNSTGLISGGYWPGYGNYTNGYHNGAVLIDTNLLLGKSLDYLNAQKGVTTDIAANTQKWLDNTTFVNPDQPGIAQSYEGNDRREILFGKVVSCVYVTASQIWYVPNHTLSDPLPIVTALPTNCSQDKPSSLELFAPWIDLNFLNGNRTQALTDFTYTIDNWIPTPGTGVNGSTGGRFNSILDPASPCSTARVLALWLESARATGYWNLNSNTRTVAEQVVNELWSLQQPGGGLSATGGSPGCRLGQVIPESGGEAILAFDPRVPSWFGITVANSATTGQISQAILPILAIAKTGYPPSLQTNLVSSNCKNIRALAFKLRHLLTLKFRMRLGRETT